MISPNQQAILDAARTLTFMLDEPLIPVDPAVIALQNLDADNHPMYNVRVLTEEERIVACMDIGRGCLVRYHERVGEEAYVDMPDTRLPFHEVCLTWDDAEYPEVAISLLDDRVDFRLYDSLHGERNVAFEASRYPKWQAKLLGSLSVIAEAQLRI